MSRDAGSKITSLFLLNVDFTSESMWPGLKELKSLSKKIEAEKNGDPIGYMENGGTNHKPPRKLTTVNPLHPTNLVMPEISN